jgi:hypothetical protein
VATQNRLCVSPACATIAVHDSCDAGVEISRDSRQYTQRHRARSLQVFNNPLMGQRSVRVLLHDVGQVRRIYRELHVDRLADIDQLERRRLAQRRVNLVARKSMRRSLANTRTCRSGRRLSSSSSASVIE